MKFRSTTVLFRPTYPKITISIFTTKSIDDFRRQERIFARQARRDHVIEETITLLARRLGYLLAADMATRLYSSAKLDIVSISREEELEALRFFRKFADQSVSFADCISFAIMKRNRISTAFTFDRHFREAGFRVLGMK